MNKKHLFPLLLLTISLAAADQHQNQRAPMSVQRMGGVTDKIIHTMRTNPEATVYCTTGAAAGCTATAIYVCASPAMAIKLGSMSSACCCASVFLCGIGFCATSPVARLFNTLNE